MKILIGFLFFGIHRIFFCSYGRDDFFFESSFSDSDSMRFDLHRLVQTFSSF